MCSHTVITPPPEPGAAERLIWSGLTSPAKLQRLMDCSAALAGSSSLNSNWGREWTLQIFRVVKIRFSIRSPNRAAREQDNILRPHAPISAPASLSPVLALDCLPQPGLTQSMPLLPADQVQNKAGPGRSWEAVVGGSGAPVLTSILLISLKGDWSRSDGNSRSANKESKFRRMRCARPCRRLQFWVWVQALLFWVLCSFRQAIKVWIKSMWSFPCWEHLRPSEECWEIFSTDLLGKMAVRTRLCPS